MALKDWKKVKDTKGNVVWKGYVEGNYSYQNPSGMGALNKFIIDKRGYGLKGYWFARFVNGRMVDRKLFSTKKEAVSYAKKEMRRISKYKEVM